MSESIEIAFTLNGRPVTTKADPAETLLSWLRKHGIKSVKCACETTNCGLCTVLVDGSPELSCALIMSRVSGHEVLTLEGMGRERKELAECLAAEGADQCGFCAPGLEMAVLALDRTNPDATDHEMRSFLANNLCRCTGYTSQMRAIRRFLGRDRAAGAEISQGSAEAEAAVEQVRKAAAEIETPDRGKTLSSAVVKKDAEALLAGRPVYTDDLAPDDAYIVRLVRSSVPHGRVLSVDTEKALAIPGVVAIYTSKDVPHHRFTLAGQSYLEMSPYDTCILDDTVRYIGDEVAIVVAENEVAAELAMHAVKVKYEKLPYVLDVRESLDNPCIIHDEDDWAFGGDKTGDPKRNLVATGGHEYGDVDAGFEAADVVLAHTYHTQAAEQSMMETFRCYATTDAFGRITIVSSTQVPFHIRRQVATALGIPQSRVRVVKPRVGGGFGAKQSGSCEVYAAFAAIQTGHPCKCILTRQETLSATNSRHEMYLTVKIGAKRDGTLTAIDLHVLSNAGAYGYHGSTTVTLAAGKTLPIYNQVPSRFAYNVCYTDTMPGGAFRGYGATQGCFAVESAVNEMADTLGMDPAEIRLKNLVTAGQNLHQLNEEPLRSCRAVECLKRALEMAGWKDRPLSEDLGDRVRGIGLALTMQGSGISNVDIANADITLEDDGFYILDIGATDVGTGADTILAQIAAEVLECPVDDIVVKGVDTDTSPYDTGAYASSGTYTSGGAVLRAAEELKRKICAQAASWWKAAPDEVTFSEGVVTSADGTQQMSVKELANRAIGFGLNQGHLSGHGANTQPQSPPPFMAGVAEVEVDKATGKVTLTDYAAVVDCGTVINVPLARVQAEGGLVQGIGMALTEQVVYDAHGHMRTDSFMHYKIPSRLDVPDMRVEFMPSYEPTGPFGAKSIGEVVINTPSPAIASAVAHATGRYVRSLPILPEKVLLGEDG